MSLSLYCFEMSDNFADKLLASFLARHELRCFVDDRVKARVQKELRNAPPPKARTEQALRDLVEDSAKMRDIFNSMVSRVQKSATDECNRIANDAVDRSSITSRVEDRADKRLKALEQRYEQGVSRANWMAGTALAASAAAAGTTLYVLSQVMQARM